jgi:CheY-like chemotaxis protein
MTASAPRLTVLVVDHDTDVRRRAAVEMFEALGTVVLDAHNGRKARRILSFNPRIALLFADARMPDISGVELAHQTRRMRPDLDVAPTSAYAAGEAVTAFPLVGKPDELSDLAALRESARGATTTMPQPAP